MATASNIRIVRPPPLCMSHGAPAQKYKEMVKEEKEKSHFCGRTWIRFLFSSTSIQSFLFLAPSKSKVKKEKQSLVVSRMRREKKKMKITVFRFCRRKAQSCQEGEGEEERTDHGSRRDAKTHLKII